MTVDQYDTRSLHSVDRSAAPKYRQVGQFNFFDSHDDYSPANGGMPAPLGLQPQGLHPSRSVSANHYARPSSASSSTTSSGGGVANHTNFPVNSHRYGGVYSHDAALNQFNLHSNDSDTSSTLNYDTDIAPRFRRNAPAAFDSLSAVNIPFRAEEFALPVRERPQALGPSFSDELPSKPPFEYPDGYHCEKCKNTGIKIKGGRSCTQCYEKFAQQDPSVTILNPPISTRQFEKHSALSKTREVRKRSKFVNPLLKVIDPLPDCPPVMVKYGDMAPLVVTPGDPAIGGTVCGRCRGIGVFTVDVIYETTCKTCRGLGRLI